MFGMQQPHHPRYPPTMSPPAPCEHTCTQRNCVNSSGKNLWATGSGGSLKKHMASKTKHPHCAIGCPKYQGALPTAVTSPQPSDLATPQPQRIFRLLVIFDVDNRHDNLADPNMKSARWAPHEFSEERAATLMNNPALKGFIQGPTLQVRPGTVSLSCLDNVRPLNMLCWLQTSDRYPLATVHGRNVSIWVL
jgi:hypothetical protein